MRTSNNNIGDILLAKCNAVGNWLVKHAKIVMPVVLLVCVAVTVFVSVNANKKDAENKEDVEANVTVDETADTEYVVPLVPLQENTVPEITELINRYYTARANGDTETIREIKNGLDESEAIRIEETGKYTESYPTLNIYTKVGPTENSYLVYVESTLKFKDFEEPVPGMMAYYVRADENGEYHIIENAKLDDYEEDYMRKVNLQDDVVDLNNKVTVEYNDMVAGDVDLAQFLLDMNTEIEKNVGAYLAQSQEPEESEEGTETEQTESAEEQEPETQTVVTKVRATDVVNIRTSDSETADKLGKAAIGDEFTLIEKIGNGWSKIEYEGAEAYIKSEFLEDIETTEVAAGNDEEQETEENPTTTAADVASSGTVTVLETVRVRSSASETSEKLGTVYAGEKLELVMKQADGWTKIKYKGSIAYVKSDYVE